MQYQACHAHWGLIEYSCHSCLQSDVMFRNVEMCACLQARHPSLVNTPTGYGNFDIPSLRDHFRGVSQPPYRPTPTGRIVGLVLQTVLG